MINIIGGTKRRATIQVPLNNVRPTSIKKRESIFSVLESYGLKNNINIYNKKNIFDLFAGTGALGLEAISRGASFSYFFENNNNVIYFLKKNCQKICKTNQFEIKKEDIISSKFNNIDKKISLVFIDPPYEMNPFKEVFNNIYQSKILSKNAIIVLECSHKMKVKIPSFLSCFSEKYYGKTKIHFLVNNIY